MSNQPSIKARIRHMGPGTKKLDEDKVREIRRRLASGDSRDDIARDFKISTSTVSAIRTRASWAHVDAVSPV